MIFEFSAGGVVYNKDKGVLKILVCKHSMHHGWVFPKGIIGDNVKDEKKEATAVREVEEETGAKGEIVVELSPVTYWYQFKNEKIKKTVYYFVMKYVGGDIAKHDHEMEDVEWILPEDVPGRLTYKSDKEVFKEALPVIKSLV